MIIRRLGRHVVPLWLPQTIYNSLQVSLRHCLYCFKGIQLNSKDNGVCTLKHKTFSFIRLTWHTIHYKATHFKEFEEKKLPTGANIRKSRITIKNTGLWQSQSILGLSESSSSFLSSLPSILSNVIKLANRGALDLLQSLQKPKIKIKDT